MAEWLRTFCPISQESEFSQISDLCRNTANNIDFHYRTNSVKINDKIFQYIQRKPVFGPFLSHFPIFGAKRFFSGKPGSVMHNFTWVSSTMPKFRKTNDTILRKRLDRRKDRQTLLHRTLPANAGCPLRVDKI